MNWRPFCLPIVEKQCAQQTQRDDFERIEGDGTLELVGSTDLVDNMRCRREIFFEPNRKFKKSPSGTKIPILQEKKYESSGEIVFLRPHGSGTWTDPRQILDDESRSFVIFLDVEHFCSILSVFCYSAYEYRRRNALRTDDRALDRIGAA